MDEINSHALNNSVFLTSLWQLTWIESLAYKPFMLLFYLEKNIIGLAFIGKQKSAWGDVYYLNQTGKHAGDQVWIEQNDIICAEQHKIACRHAFLERLITIPNFHKVVLSHTIDINWSHHKALLWDKIIHKSARVKLEALLSKEVDYLSTLSKNSRSTLRRAKKYIETHYGQIEFKVVNEQKAKTLKNDIAKLHIQKWGESQYGSGFVNPQFTEFHTRMCEQKERELETEIIAFTAGRKILGYLYFINKHPTANFYLSAIDYSDGSNKFKPGLVMHALAIEYFVGKKYQYYDFLAGDARYKESLSNDHYYMYTLELTSTHPVNKILFGLKSILKKLRRTKG
ncbi:GNAT family N-acetyltransferase [Agaribacter flavus]|uniref:GNAT family N-acetyltransferase n=1 Tax=Agaribacter flavus TaxID=1902781 RepID=A0ABV7FRK7_9ALTE